MSVLDNFKVLLAIKLAHYQLLIISHSASLLPLRESFTFFSVVVKMKMSASEFWLHFLQLSLGKVYPHHLPHPSF